jgi:hypothetical protein
VFVIMRQSQRSFVETIDFRTSPGNLGGAEQAEAIRLAGGWQARGPSVVVVSPCEMMGYGRLSLPLMRCGATREPENSSKRCRSRRASPMEVLQE